MMILVRGRCVTKGGKRNLGKMLCFFISVKLQHWGQAFASAIFHISYISRLNLVQSLGVGSECEVDV